MTRWIALALSGLLLTSACVRSAPGDPSPADDPTVELVVRNERLWTTTAYVEWQGVRPVRLGEITGGETETFLPPFRGGAVRVVFGLVGSTADDPHDLPFIPVVRGDRLEWVLLTDGSIFYRRLEEF